MQTQPWKLHTTRLMFRVLGTVAPRVAANRAYTLFNTPRFRRISARDQAVLNAAERLHSTFRDSALTGYAWGEEGRPQILLVHGWEGHVGNFSSLVMPLVNAGFRVIGFDGPAHGDSDGTTSNVIDYASVLSDLMVEFGPMHGVVAHSLGAPAIVFMMSTMMHYRIKRLVLIGAPCEFTDVLARFADELSLTPRTLHQMERLTHERLGIPMSAVSLKAMIPYITTPGLVIHDRRDPVIPFDDAETIAAHWQGSELIATEGLGHNKTLRHAGTIYRIVDFIAEPQFGEITV